MLFSVKITCKVDISSVNNLWLNYLISGAFRMENHTSPRSWVVRLVGESLYRFMHECFATWRVKCALIRHSDCISNSVICYIVHISKCRNKVTTDCNKELLLNVTLFLATRRDTSFFPIPCSAVGYSHLSEVDWSTANSPLLLGNYSYESSE